MTLLEQKFAKSKGVACGLSFFAFCGCDEYHDQKNHEEQSVHLTVQPTVLPKEKSGQELKARTRRQALKQRPWRNVAYWFACLALPSLYFCNPGPPSHSRLDLPIAVINQENAPTDLPIIGHDRGMFLN